MYLRFHYAAIWTYSLALIPACTIKDGGDTDPSTGTAESESGELTDGATEPGPTSTESDPTDGSATDDSATDDSATDGSATSTETDGAEFPEECDAADPSVSSAFELDITAWPIDLESHTFSNVPCTVEAVSSEAGAVTTLLACEHEGAPQTATLTIAAASEGAPAWAAGDVVRLASRVGEDNLGSSSFRHVQLRGAEDSLLVSAEQSQNYDGIELRYKPLVVGLSYACTGQDAFGDLPMRVDFAAPGEPVVGIFHGHRGVVPISAGELFAIDVATAIGTDTHPDSNLEILLRRVKIE